MLILGSFFWPSTQGIPPPPPVIVDQPIQPSGGSPARDIYYRRPPDAVRKERERLGIIEVIHRVAERQVETLNHDAQQHLEELERELELQGIEWEGRYLELLNAKRQALIDEEIGLRLRQLQIEEEEISIALLLLTL